MTIEEQTELLEDSILKLINRFEQDTGSTVSAIVVSHGQPGWTAESVYCDCRNMEIRAELYRDFKGEQKQSKTKSFEQWVAEKYATRKAS